MKIANILKIPSIDILIYIYDNGGEVRYTDLADRIGSRGTLSKSLKDLMAEKLMDKRIEKGKPTKAFYFLTSKGKEVAKRLNEINRYYS